MKNVRQKIYWVHEKQRKDLKGTAKWQGKGAMGGINRQAFLDPLHFRRFFT
jgi:hypothetical protein